MTLCRYCNKFLALIMSTRRHLDLPTKEKVFQRRRKHKNVNFLPDTYDGYG